jgi:flagellar motor switch protein FliM
MTNILSQDEVDSLLKGIDEGKIAAQGEVTEESGDLPSYDFRKEHGPVQQRMPGIGVIQERYTGLLKASLSAVAASQVDVNPPESASVVFSDFCRSISLPASFNLFKMEPLRGVSMIVMDGALVFAFVDLFLGGTGERHVKLEGKNFTPIELRIIEKIVKVLLDNLQQAWSDVQKLRMVFLRSEIDPQFAEIARPDEAVLVAKFTVEIGNFSGRMMICMPFAMLEPLRGKLRGGFRGENLGVDETWRKHLEGKIVELKANVSCSLGHSRITGRELLKMKVDDVLPLEQRPDDPVIVRVEGVPKFKGHLGAFRQNKAVRISERLNRGVDHG